MSDKISRRKALGLSLGLFAGFITTIKADCDPTPQQTEGPFYPENLAQEKDNDLTWVKGGKRQAKGDIIYIFGTVRDENCQIVTNALVEIWQAGANGRYNHSADPSEQPLDENFQYWGRCITNEQGQYSFKTIRPGTYLVNPRWRRPPHIHFKIAKRGYEEVTSQMYFAGNALNKRDRILNRLSKQQQDDVVVELQEPQEAYDYTKISDFENVEERSRVCYFNIVLPEIYS